MPLTFSSPGVADDISFAESTASCCVCGGNREVRQLLAALQRAESRAAAAERSRRAAEDDLAAFQARYGVDDWT